MGGMYDPNSVVRQGEATTNADPLAPRPGESPQEHQMRVQRAMKAREYLKQNPQSQMGEYVNVPKEESDVWENIKNWLNRMFQGETSSEAGGGLVERRRQSIK
jgi:hypothetical protein